MMRPLKSMCMRDITRDVVRVRQLTGDMLYLSYGVDDRTHRCQVTNGVPNEKPPSFISPEIRVPLVQL